MRLKDEMSTIGKFTIKTYDSDGLVDVYEEKNLIMDLARKSMAYSIGGVDTDPNLGNPINKIVIGTRGHVGTDVLDNKQVGSDGFVSTRTELFSEENPTDYNYGIVFDPSGGISISKDGTGTLYQGSTQISVDADPCTVARVVSDRTVTYTVTIPITNANNPTPGEVLAYTEAALYTNDSIFSMKTFPARVKEDTVKFVIEWSLLF